MARTWAVQLRGSLVDCEVRRKGLWHNNDDVDMTL